MTSFIDFSFPRNITDEKALNLIYKTIQHSLTTAKFDSDKVLPARYRLINIEFRENNITISCHKGLIRLDSIVSIIKNTLDYVEKMLTEQIEFKTINISYYLTQNNDFILQSVLASDTFRDILRTYNNNTRWYQLITPNSIYPSHKHAIDNLSDLGVLEYFEADECPYGDKCFYIGIIDKKFFSEKWLDFSVFIKLAELSNSMPNPLHIMTWFKYKVNNKLYNGDILIINDNPIYIKTMPTLYYGIEDVKHEILMHCKNLNIFLNNAFIVVRDNEEYLKETKKYNDGIIDIITISELIEIVKKKIPY